MACPAATLLPQPTKACDQISCARHRLRTHGLMLHNPSYVATQGIAHLQIVHINCQATLSMDKSLSLMLGPVNVG